MAFYRKLYPQDRDNIIKLLKEFHTYQSIATMYGVSRECIRQIAKANGLQGLGRRARKDINAEKITSKLKELYGQFYEDGVINRGDFLDICKHKFRNKKSSAKLPWTIKFSDIVWNTYCPILGIQLDYYAESRQENSPSFDRINSNLAYIPGNVQIISWRANRIKNDGTWEEHQRIADHLKSLSS